MNMSTPQFSVVMPVFNGERFIEAAVRSVLEQTLGDFELLVSDDGSTDLTVSIVQRIAASDPRVQLLQRKASGGPGGNRNSAMQYAKAPWLTFLDADDLWPPDHLALCAEAIRACPDTAIFFGDYHRFTDGPQSASPPVLEGKTFFDTHAPYVEGVARLPGGVEMFRMRSGELLKFCCLYHCPITTQAVTLNRRVMLSNDIRFREDWLINEDFHVWMRMLESGSAVAVRHVLAFYRFNPDSLTGNPIRFFEGMALSHSEWMRRIWKVLSETERRTYRSKIAGYLQSATWQYSIAGRAFDAVSAQIRANRIWPESRATSGVPRTFLRAVWWRTRKSLGMRPATLRSSK
jgi:glycosyltransferase involved in cell wall biosynthesis